MTKRITIDLDIEEIGMLHKALAIYLTLPATTGRDLDVIDSINKKISPQPPTWSLELKNNGEIAMRQTGEQKEQYRAWWEQQSHDDHAVD